MSCHVKEARHHIYVNKRLSRNPTQYSNSVLKLLSVFNFHPPEKLTLTTMTMTVTLLLLVMSSGLSAADTDNPPDLPVYNDTCNYLTSVTTKTELAFMFVMLGALGIKLNLASLVNDTSLQTELDDNFF